MSVTVGNWKKGGPICYVKESRTKPLGKKVGKLIPITTGDTGIFKKCTVKHLRPRFHPVSSVYCHSAVILFLTKDRKCTVRKRFGRVLRYRPTRNRDTGDGDRRQIRVRNGRSKPRKTKPQIYVVKRAQTKLTQRQDKNTPSRFVTSPFRSQMDSRRLFYRSPTSRREKGFRRPSKQ